MGHGNYSQAAHAAIIADRANDAHREVFTQRQCHPLMNKNNREHDADQQP